MARSSYIYVVIPKGHMTPMAAFTVKRELATWLSRRMFAETPRIYRTADGAWGADVSFTEGSSLTDITPSFFR